jgi:sec-independent protein translocase protein TatB
LFILALLLFGPKKLPVLARELGKWVGEFRRASNEFKMQMEEELRVSEQADRQKQIAAMEAAAPVTPALPAETVDAGGVRTADPSVGPLRMTIPPEVEGATTTLPIAVSGDLKIMPPATGLPQPRGDSNGGAGTACWSPFQ